MHDHTSGTRREFLSRSVALGGAAWLARSAAEAAQPDAGSTESPRPASTAGEARRRPRVASINSIYRHRSHAYHIAGRLIDGYTIDGAHHQPPFDLARMYNHQYPADDRSPDVCRRHGIELCDTVAAALGGDRLDVDAVLLIVEHGDYPRNELGQTLYPRYEHFEQIVEVFRRANRSVPVFVDKHLSYDHRLAGKMVAAGRELNFPMMAGSSLPVTFRMPEVEPALETPFRDSVLVFGYPVENVEIYLFHALEALQCMVERRRGGESGVRRVRFLEGPAVWAAGDEGQWSWELLRTALGRCPANDVTPPRENVVLPQAVLIDYVDGTRAAILNLYEQTTDFAFAGAVEGRDQPISTHFYLPPPPGAKFFNALTYRIEQFFLTGQPPYPIERTLLTSTLCEFAMRSKHAGGAIDDAAMRIAYQPPASGGFMRGSFVDVY